jgi:hypothetical protein
MKKAMTFWQLKRGSENNNFLKTIVEAKAVCKPKAESTRIHLFSALGYCHSTPE